MPKLTPILSPICGLVARSVTEHVVSAADPPPPVPPGPLDLLVPGDLNGVAFQYANAETNLHCRIGGINAGGTAAPAITVTVDGDPMTFIGRDTRAIVGQPIAVAFYISGLAPGTHDIAISVAGGSVRNCAVRLGELVSQSGIGEVSGPSVQNNVDYYLELYCGSDASPATSQFGSIAAFSNQNAYDSYSSFDDTEQWNTWQAGMTARFATEAGPPGEGGNPSLLVYYTRNGSNYGGAGLVYEILNAVLPG